MTLITDIGVTDKSVVKSTLIRRVAEKCKDVHPKDIEMAIKHILDCMVQTLNTGGRIEIRDFAALSLRYRQPKKAHNPRTGESVETTGKYVPYFRAGKELRLRVNKKIERVEKKEVEESFA